MTRMNIYIWQDVEGLTAEWHNGGGAAVAAESVEAALEALKLSCGPYVTPWGTERKGSTPIPDGDPIVYALAGDVEPRVFKFPDSGCC